MTIKEKDRFDVIGQNINYIIDSIENGCYKTIEEVKNEFDVDYWGELEEKDVVLLQKALDNFLASEKNDEKTI